MHLVGQVLYYQFTTSLSLYYQFTCFSGANVQILTRHLGGSRRAARGRHCGTPGMTEGNGKRVHRGVPGGMLVLGV